MTAHPAAAESSGSSGAGLPVDWSHRHLIYSNPDTREEAAAKGLLNEWARKAKDPRFVLRLEQKETEIAARKLATGGNDSSRKTAAAAKTEITGSAVATGKVPSAPMPIVVPTPSPTPVPLLRLPKPTPDPMPTPIPPVEPDPGLVHRDWSAVMGGATGVGRARLYPAKFAFGISTKDCTNDFVVHVTNAAGAAGTSGTLASRTGTFTAQPTAGQTATVGSTAHGSSIVLTADASLDTGLKFSIGGTTTITAANLANAINRNGAAAGVTASSSGAVVTVTAVTWGATPNTDITLAETMSNFTWAGATLTGGTGTAAQPTIFALNQLYADTVANGGCQTSTQAVPNVMWSYNTGTGATADLSPALSLNGDQVAFIQKTASVASLVLLKWSASSPGTLGVPTAPTSVAAGSYRACSAPCMTVITLNGSPNDTHSAPFVDYLNDNLYVGDDAGKLHKFTGVFSGTPAEQTTGGFPATVSSGNKLSSPVFDSGSNDVGGHLVFVGSNGVAGGNGNRLHSVNTSGTVVSSGAIGSVSTANGVLDAPIVDSAAQRVYAFMGQDNAAADSTGAACALAACAAVYQFSTASSLATQNLGLGAGLGAKIIVGGGDDKNDTNRSLNAGAFDNTYYTSASGSNPSGSLYVCGGPSSADTRHPTLWKITITNNSFGSALEGPNLINVGSANANDGCSPVTVFKNGSTEYLFAAVTADDLGSTTGGCTAPATGCIYMYQVPSGASFDTTTTNSTINDNTVRYFSVSASAALNTTEASVTTTLTAAQAGSYTGMKITQSAVSPAGTTFTYFLRKNSANTAITCAIGAGVATCSDTTNTASFSNGDTIDVSVQRTAGAGALTNRTFRVQLGFTSASTPAAALNAIGGTGGIIIDNTVSGGGSQIYYSTRTSPGNAVQASQAALQ